MNHSHYISPKRRVSREKLSEVDANRLLAPTVPSSWQEPSRIKTRTRGGVDWGVVAIYAVIVGTTVAAIVGLFML